MDDVVPEYLRMRILTMFKNKISDLKRFVLFPCLPVWSLPSTKAGPLRTTFLIWRNSSSGLSPPMMVKPRPRSPLSRRVVNTSPRSSAGCFTKTRFARAETPGIIHQPHTWWLVGGLVLPSSKVLDLTRCMSLFHFPSTTHWEIYKGSYWQLSTSTMALFHFCLSF